MKTLHVHVSPSARTWPINVRLPVGLIVAIKAQAQKKDVPYQRLLKQALAKSFGWKPRPVKCGGPGCSPYGNVDWKGPKPKRKKLDMRIREVEW